MTADFRFRSLKELCLFLYRYSKKERVFTSFWTQNDCLIADQVKNKVASTEHFLKECRAFDFTQVTAELESFFSETPNETVLASSFSLEFEPKSTDELKTFEFLTEKGIKIATNSLPEEDDQSLSDIQCQVLLLVLSHLQLVLNCRDILATARSMLMQDQNAFIALRNTSKESNIPMCQAAISYVLRNRLGGKGYVEWANDKLSTHAPIISDFVDTVLKLQTLTEELQDPKLCLEKMVQVVRTRLAETFATGASHSALLTVCKMLKTEIPTCAENLQKLSDLTGPSPILSNNNGGSLAGKSCMRLIQVVVDKFSCEIERCDANLLNGLESSPTATVKLPALTAFFASPQVEVNIEPIEEIQIESPSQEIERKPLKIASFLNDSSPMEVDNTKLITSSQYVGKENIPPPDDQTPKRVRKNGPKRSFGPTQQKIPAARNKKIKLAKNQSQLTQFFFKPS